METFRTEHHYGLHRNQFSHHFAFLFMNAVSLRAEAYFQFIAMYCNSMPQNRKRFYMIYRFDRNHIPCRVSPEASFEHFNILFMSFKSTTTTQQKRKFKSRFTFKTALIMNDVVTVQLDI